MNDKEKLRRLVISADSRPMAAALREVLSSRDLLMMFVKRHYLVRYKQAYFGVLWNVFVPAIITLVFSVIFSHIARFATGEVSYAAWFITGFVVWQFFSNGLTYGGRCLVDNAALIDKAYFPRHVLPISAAISGLVDFLVGSVCMAIVIVFMGGSFSEQVLLAIPYFFLCLVMVLGLSLILSCLNAIFRDIGILIPVVVQIWMFASPVIYPLAAVPERLRWLFELNPMAAVLTGWRSAILGTDPPSGVSILASCVFAVTVFYVGMWLFTRIEGLFADSL